MVSASTQCPFGFTVPCNGTFGYEKVEFLSSNSFHHLEISRNKFFLGSASTITAKVCLEFLQICALVFISCLCIRLGCYSFYVTDRLTASFAFSFYVFYVLCSAAKDFITVFFFFNR